MEKLQRSGNDSGQGQQIQGETPLGTLQQQVATPTKLEIDSEAVTTTTRRMEELSSAMANLRRESAETTNTAGKSSSDIEQVLPSAASAIQAPERIANEVRQVAAPFTAAADEQTTRTEQAITRAAQPQSRDQLATDLEARMQRAAAAGNWDEVRAAREELTQSFAVMGEKPPATIAGKLNLAAVPQDEVMPGVTMYDRETRLESDRRRDEFGGGLRRTAYTSGNEYAGEDRPRRASADAEAEIERFQPRTGVEDKVSAAVDSIFNAPKPPDYREAYSSARAADAEEQRSAVGAERARQIQSTAQLEYQLSSVTGRREQAATIRTAALDEEENSPRQLRLLSRANRLDQQEDEAGEEEPDESGGGPGRSRGGVFSLRGLSRRVQGGILLYEALRVGQGYADYQDQMATARGPMDTITAEQGLQQTVEGVPLLGQAAGLAARGLQRLPGFGGFDPGSTEQAYTNMRYSIEAVQGGEGAVRQQLEDRTSVTGLNRQADVNETQGALAQQLGQVDAAHDAAIQARKDQITLLQEQLDNAQATGDQATINTITPQLNRLNRDTPAFNQAQDRLRGSEIIRINTQLGYQAPAQLLMANNQPGEAGESSFFGGIAQQFGAVKPEQPENIREAAIRSINSHEGQIDYGVDVAEGQDRVAAYQLAHQPLQGQFQDVENQRKQALDEASVANERDIKAIPRDRFATQSEYDETIRRIRFGNGRVTGEINNRFDMRRDLVQQEYTEKGDRLNTDLGSSGQQIDALRGIGFGGIPNEIAASAIGTAQGGIDQAIDLARGGFSDQGLKLLGNTRSEIDLTRERYERGFRGTQVDPLRQNINNPRDIADVAGTLRALDQQEARLPKSVNELNQAAGVRNVPGVGATSGTGNSVGMMSPDELERRIAAALATALAN